MSRAALVGEQEAPVVRACLRNDPADGVEIDLLGTVIDKEVSAFGTSNQCHADLLCQRLTHFCGARTGQQYRYTHLGNLDHHLGS